MKIFLTIIALLLLVMLSNFYGWLKGRISAFEEMAEIIKDEIKKFDEKRNSQQGPGL